MILDPQRRSDAYLYIEVEDQDVNIGHEASVSRIGEEQLFYLASRGLNEAEATTMIVSGFIEPLVRELPMEYAVEMNRLIDLQMEGTVGWYQAIARRSDDLAPVGGTKGGGLEVTTPCY